MFFYYVLLLVSHIFSYFLPNQNNPTEDWSRLIGMHNEKNDFWFFFKIELSVFANELFIYIDR